MRALTICFALCVLVSCERSAPKQSPAPATNTIGATTTEAPPTVSLDPRLSKLAETPDPDLESKMTDAEIRAALRGAAYTPEAIAAPTRPATVGPSEWSRMEKVRAAKVKQWQEFLTNTRIAIGPDNLYHQQGCQVLFTMRVENGRPVQTYIGRNTVLATAAQSNLRPHTDCAPPSHAVPPGFWDTEG
jgi:hypothetical protein